MRGSCSVWVGTVEGMPGVEMSNSPRHVERDQQCVGPRGWTVDSKERRGKRCDSRVSPHGRSANRLGGGVPWGGRILAKRLPRCPPRINSALCFPAVKLAATPVLFSLRCVGRWDSPCWDHFQRMVGFSPHVHVSGEEVCRS